MANKGRNHRVLLVALLLSFLVHWVAINGWGGWWIAWHKPERVTLNVVIAAITQPVEKAGPLLPAAAHSGSPQARPKSPKTKAESEPVETRSSPPGEPDALKKPEPLPTPEPVPESTPPQTPDPEPQPQTGETEPAEPVVTAPAKVTMHWQVVHKGSALADETQTFELLPEGRYRLKSLAKPKGLLALALADLEQKSEGRMMAQGLQPEYFLYRYGDKVQQARFDWEQHVLTMESGSRKQTAELIEGTQDLMSFMYQFMFVPPLQDMQLKVTNGKKLMLYQYRFDGEETLNTGLGPLNTIRISKGNGGDGDEKTELWLATEYRHLPVKISKTEKDGTQTDRIATDWQIE